MKTIIQISDTHLTDSPENKFIQIDPEHTFHQITDDMIAKYKNIDTIIHTGDVAQVAKAETYQRYLQHMEKLKIPFYQVPGNHDDLSIFPYHQNSPISIIHLDHWCIILLTSAVKGRIDGCISEDQLEKLARLLEQNQTLHTVIGCHHHPLLMESEWIDTHCLKNTDALLKILKKHPQVKAIISGHVHQEAKIELDNIQFLSVPSTSVQFKPKSKDFALDTIQAGYRAIHLHDNGHFETQVHRLAAPLPQINENISGY